MQVVRNALMTLVDHADRFTFLIRDHGPQLTESYDAAFHTADIDIGNVTTSIQAMVTNTIQERQRRTIHAEPLDRIPVWNLAHLLHALAEYESFYNEHRPYRALGHTAPMRPLPENPIDLDHFRITRHHRIGSTLHKYHHAACRAWTDSSALSPRNNTAAHRTNPTGSSTSAPATMAGETANGQCEKRPPADYLVNSHGAFGSPSHGGNTIPGPFCFPPPWAEKPSDGLSYGAGISPNGQVKLMVGCPTSVGRVGLEPTTQGL